MSQTTSHLVRSKLTDLERPIIEHKTLKEMIEPSIQLDSIETDPAIHERDMHGNTPLHIAAKQQNIDKIYELVKQGAQTDTRNDMGKTPLHIMFPEQPTLTEADLGDLLVRASKDNNGSQLLLLFSLGMSLHMLDDEHIIPLIFSAVRQGYHMVPMRLLLTELKFEYDFTKEENAEGETLIDIALEERQFLFLLAMMLYDNSIVNKDLDKYQNSLMHLCAVYQGKEFLMMASNFKADLFKLNIKNEAPIDYISAHCDHEFTINFITQSDIKIQEAILHHALKAKNNKLLAQLLEVRPEQARRLKNKAVILSLPESQWAPLLSKLDTDELRALLKHAIVTDNMLAVETILRIAPDLADKPLDPQGNSALHYAANLNLESLILLLHAHGLKINLKNKRRETPLNVALRYGSEEALIAMIEHSPTLDINQCLYGKSRRSLWFMAHKLGLKKIQAFVASHPRFDQNIPKREKIKSCALGTGIAIECGALSALSAFMFLGLSEPQLGFIMLMAGGFGTLFTGVLLAHKGIPKRKQQEKLWLTAAAPLAAIGFFELLSIVAPHLAILATWYAAPKSLIASIGISGLMSMVFPFILSLTHTFNWMKIRRRKHRRHTRQVKFKENIQLSDLMGSGSTQRTPHILPRFEPTIDLAPYASTLTPLSTEPTPTQVNQEVKKQAVETSV